MSSSSSKGKFVIEQYNTGYGWVLKVRGQPIAKSARQYQNKSQVRKSIEAFVNHAQSASIVEE